VLVAAASFWPAGKLGTEFMPTLNEGTLFYMPTGLPGMSVNQASTILQKQNQILKSFPEVASVIARPAVPTPPPTRRRSRCSRR